MATGDDPTPADEERVATGDEPTPADEKRRATGAERTSADEPPGATADTADHERPGTATAHEARLASGEVGPTGSGVPSMALAVLPTVHEARLRCRPQPSRRRPRTPRRSPRPTRRGSLGEAQPTHLAAQTTADKDNEKGEPR
ncbi:hypothetical protein [Streptomyces europaeiscabiei]|uniref:hypothetical protein n=1 Tax=Streptomyces europaeiscabiei TaxID=146819 RepID=UPI0038F78457